MWNRALGEAPKTCDVLLLTSNKRAVVSNWVPTLAGVLGHWSGLVGDERAVAWCGLPEFSEDIFEGA